jgi:hypothetical protein
MLDSLVDRARDESLGSPGFIRLFEDPDELAAAMLALLIEALGRVRETSHGTHHEMTLAGVVAYWTTDPGAADPRTRHLVAELRAELSPTIWPALAVMRLWRAAKQTHSVADKRRHALERVKCDGRLPSGLQ